MNSLLYIGMDVHKESIAIAVFRDNNRNTEFERQMKNEPAQINKFLSETKR